MQTTIDGKQVHYIEKGSGQPVLLLHGWDSPAENYSLIINHLSNSFRVVAPDLPGFGASQEPDIAWSIDDFVDFTIKFMQKVNIVDPILIGHSNGGRIVIKLVTKPNLSHNVEKIILINSAGIVPKRSLGYYFKIYSYKIGKKLFPKKAEKMRKKVGSSDYNKATPIMRQTMVKALNEDLTPYLPSINASTLLIWGDLDTATPLEQGQLMEKKIPDAGLVILKGTGHFSFSQAWNQCSRVLDSFLL